MLRDMKVQTITAPLRRVLGAAVSVAMVLLATTAGPGWAQSDLPAGSPGRFTMQPADGGILRLDTQTGALSMCRRASGGWSCEMMPDDRKASADEMAGLKAENDALKSAVKRLEETAGVPDAQKPGGAEKRQSGVQLPTEEDVDKAMSYVQRMMKKFKDKLKELEEPDGRKGTVL